jgi:hypothetical protein
MGYSQKKERYFSSFSPDDIIYGSGLGQRNQINAS